jgi:hypothetical protein
MLNINDGDGIGVWVRPSPPGTRQTDPYLEGTAGSLQLALWRAMAATAKRERLDDGEKVLVQVEAGSCLELGVIDDSAVPERGSARYKGTRVIRSLVTGRTILRSEGRVVKLLGYYKQLTMAGRTRPERALPAADAPVVVSIWRAEIWWEGLFSMLFWALGFLESESRGGAGSLHGFAPTHCLIDWTDERTCFHPSCKRSSPKNAWLSLFEPPPALETSAAAAPVDAAALAEAASAGRLRVSVRYGQSTGAFRKLGDLIGADAVTNEAMRGGRLDEATAAVGRAAVGRWIVVRPALKERASKLEEHMRASTPSCGEAASSIASSESMSKWLGVHVRRSDKLVQCPQNDLAPDDLLAQIRSYCAALGCSCVFLCSCDGQLKKALSAKLEDEGLRCASLEDAALSSHAALPPHMDDAVDARRNAEDCLVEVLVLSRCAALLSTWSHVSVAAVYFAPDGFRHFMFGEAPPAPAAREQPTTTTLQPAAEGASQEAPLKEQIGGSTSVDQDRRTGLASEGQASERHGSTVWNTRSIQPRLHLQTRRMATRQQSRWRTED